MPIATLIRGLDYATGAEASISVPALAPAEAFAPIPIWAGMFLAGSLTLLTGVASRRHFIVWLGHSMLMLPYTLLGIGLMLGEETGHQPVVSDITVHEHVIGISIQRGERIQVAGVGQRIQVDDPDALAYGFQYEITTNESGTAGY